MYSLGYANLLLSQALLDRCRQPHLLVVRPGLGVPDEETFARQTILLDRPLMMIGRDPACAIVLPDRFASRFHAVLSREQTENFSHYWLQDGKDRPSANGVFVNGERLQGSCRLKDGDQVRFGTRVLSSFHQVRVPTEYDQLQQEHLAPLLLEAGLLTQSQLAEALAERGSRQMLLSEIVVLRNWLKPETVEFIFEEANHPLAFGPGQHPLGEYLKSAGLVSEAQVVEALRLQKQQQIYFGAALVERGYLQQRTLDFFLRRYGQRQKEASRQTSPF